MTTQRSGYTYKLRHAATIVKIVEEYPRMPLLRAEDQDRAEALGLLVPKTRIYVEIEACHDFEISAQIPEEERMFRMRDPFYHNWETEHGHL